MSLIVRPPERLIRVSPSRNASAALPSTRTDWREPATLHRLFESVDTPLEDTGVGPAPPETVALWVKLVATMGPDELADFEERTFRQWNRASLFDLRRAIERRRQELAG